MTNHFSLARFLLWIPPLLWYRIIWGFSAQTASASGKVSDGLLHRILIVLSPAYARSEADIQGAAVEVLSFFERKIKSKPDYPLKTLYPRAFQTGQNHLIYYDFTTVE